MADKDLADFPNVEAKLQKPTKQSAFERQKAEAQAKRQREAAETAAVYADFVKSFDDDDDDDAGNAHGTGRTQPGGAGRPPRPPLSQGQTPGVSGPSRRHFGAAPSGLKSGPGSLGPAPGSFTKKRSFQDFARARDQDRDRGRDRPGVGFDDQHQSQSQRPGPGSSHIPKGFEASDDEDMGDAQDRDEERAVAKPTLRLLNLPPGTSPATIKALVPGNMALENVKLLPAASSTGTERKCMIAIVAFSPETPATELDAAVSALQNRYMGYGHYLSLHRHLSSTVSNSASTMANLTSSGSSQPFGAKPVEQPATQRPTGPEGGFQRGFAPPTSYTNPGAGVSRSNLFHVPVQPPQNIKTIQLINMTIEGILEHGPEFEALLMSRPDVQRDEKWAWVWDARSEGGIWFRWRLWEVVTGSQSKKNKGRFVPLFDGGHAWKTPDKHLTFEYVTQLDEFVSDSDYNSSDDDDDMGEEVKRDGPQDVDGKAYLNPIEKAKLTHLLARLPPTISRLRKGDIARVTAFAILHASRGVDEVVELIVSNVESPLSLTKANSERATSTSEPRAADEMPASEVSDISSASLVGLYAISDILSSSSTSGVRHAWRYRQLFETCLRDSQTFEKLGLMAEKHNWGRLRADKWKRSVSLVLNLWEGWSAFTTEGQALFVSTFENPPSFKAEVKAEQEQPVQKGRWKVVESTADQATKPEIVEEPPNPEDDDVAGEPIEEDDVAGEPIDDDDIEGEPIDEDDIEGEPIDDADIEGEAMDEDEALATTPPKPATEAQTPVEEAHGGSRQPRKRMRAADMFADDETE